MTHTVLRIKSTLLTWPTGPSQSSPSLLLWSCLFLPLPSSVMLTHLPYMWSLFLLYCFCKGCSLHLELCSLIITVSSSTAILPSNHCHLFSHLYVFSFICVWVSWEKRSPLSCSPPCLAPQSISGTYQVFNKYLLKKWIPPGFLSLLFYCTHKIQQIFVE